MSHLIVCKKPAGPSVSSESRPDGSTLSCILARVPAVYLAHAILAILAFVALCELNNLRVASSTDGSIPTAPTIHLRDAWILNKNTRGQKGAD
jgi:hypothetical protein